MVLEIDILKPISMKIVVATENHLPIINQIAHETWYPTFGNILSEAQIGYMLNWMYSIDSLKSQVEEQGHHFILAQEDGKYLGYASYELNYKSESKTKIHKIYILPSAQGKGIGKVLMQYIEQEAIKAHNHSLLLNVNRNNKQALAFYNKFGFSAIGTENIDIGNGYLMEDFIMEKPIEK